MVGWSRPSLGFSLSQAEQYNLFPLLGSIFAGLFNINIFACSGVIRLPSYLICPVVDWLFIFVWL